MHSMRRILAGGGLAVALLLTPLWAPSAQAITKVSNVRISTTEAGGGAAESGGVPTDAEGAWVLFDYAGANKTKIKVDVHDSSGEPLLDRDPERYSGDGTARVELKATDLVHGAASLVDLYCDDILELAEMGADTRRVDGEIVNARSGLERDLRSLGRVLVPIDRAGLTGAALEAKLVIDRLYPQLEAAVTEILELGVNDVAAMRARLEQLEPVAKELATAAGNLDEEVGKLTAFTMAALFADNAAYTVAVTVDELGVPKTTAGSAELMVIQATSKDGNNAAGSSGTVVPPATPRLSASFDTSGSGSGARQNTPVPTTASAAGSAQGRSTTAAIEAGRPVLSTQPAPLSGSKADTVAMADKSATAVALGVTLPQEGDVGAPASNIESSSSSVQSAESAMKGAVDGSANPLAPSGSVPLPTFTVPAGGAVSGGSAPEGSGGPNLLVLGLGIVVLVGLALWFRRRL